MKKKKMVAAFGCGAVLLALLFAVIGDPVLYRNETKLQHSILKTTADAVVLGDLTAFAWDAVYTFEPYTSETQIEQIIGFSSAAIEETVSEGMTQLLFVQEEQVVCSVCAYPKNLGYGVSGLPTGQPIPNEASAPQFRIERRDGVLWLYYIPSSHQEEKQ